MPNTDEGWRNLDEGQSTVSAILDHIKDVWGGTMASESSYVIRSDESSLHIATQLEKLAHKKINVFVFEATWCSALGDPSEVRRLRNFIGGE